MMAYAEGFAGPNVVGVILSVTAAIGAALYKVNSQSTGRVLINEMPSVRKSRTDARDIRVLKALFTESYFYVS